MPVLFLALMSLKSFRDKAQNIALVSGAICFVSGLWTTHFYLNRLSDFLVWFSLLVAVVFAALSFPRRKSLLAVGVLAFSLWWSGGRAFASYHSTNTSPDGRYKLVVYSTPKLFGFPGQGGDAAGYVQFQNSSGKILAERYVELVELVGDADWGAREVEIGRGDYGFSFELP